MKRTILTATAFLTFCGTLAFAQQPAQQPAQQTAPVQQAAAPAPHRHHHNPHREAARLSQKLNLTPDQATRLEPIFANRDQQMRALHGNTSLSPQDMKQQRHAIMKSTHEQLAGVLTPDQLQQMRAMHREHMQHHDQAQPPAGL